MFSRWWAVLDILHKGLIVYVQFKYVIHDLGEWIKAFSPDRSTPPSLLFKLFQSSTHLLLLSLYSACNIGSLPGMLMVTTEVNHQPHILNQTWASYNPVGSSLLRWNTFSEQPAIFHLSFSVFQYIFFISINIKGHVFYTSHYISSP